MKVTFPHMGTAHLSLATLLGDLGLEPVVPPPTSQRTLALGVKYAPEFACFPLKVNLGNYLEALAAGAEAILMVGGVGPCRLGYYAEVQREILRKLGYDCAMVVLEPPRTRWRELLRSVRRLLPGVGLARIARAIHFAYVKIAAVDEIERLANRIRAREAHPGETTGVWRRCQEILAPVTGHAALRAAVRECRSLLAAIPLAGDGRARLRVALGGEIYMVMEPAVNFGIERVLGERGVEVHRELYLSHWLEEQLLKHFVSRRERQRLHGLARHYLAHYVGGHGVESVAMAVDAAVNRLDGMIQLMPFTCMPEIVAQSVLPAVGRSLDMPVMTLVLDEHAAEAGVLTRLEAFIDLLARRREKGERDIE
ncbi:MAG: CoA protein activase, partial [Bacteroidota bacterium]